MDYLHKIKEAPVQGITGLWGGVGSNLVGSGTPPAAPFGHTLPMSGGENWFAPGYFGVEQEESYKAPNGATLNQLYYRRLQTSAYNWWILIQRDDGSNEFVTTHGYRVYVPNGSGTAQEGPFSLSTYTEAFGGGSIPATGDHYLAWHSGVTGETPPGPPHFVDNGSGGKIKYQHDPTTTPSSNYTVTYTSNDTGEGSHMHITIA